MKKPQLINELTARLASCRSAIASTTYATLVPNGTSVRCAAGPATPPTTIRFGAAFGGSGDGALKN